MPLIMHDRVIAALYRVNSLIVPSAHKERGYICIFMELTVSTSLPYIHPLLVGGGEIRLKIRDQDSGSTLELQNRARRPCASVANGCSGWLQRWQPHTQDTPPTHPPTTHTHTSDLI